MSAAPTLHTTDEVLSPPLETSAAQRILFRVTNLYGFSRAGLKVRLNDDTVIESGELYSLLDPRAPEDANLGIVDFEKQKLWVKYGFQIVCPRLYDMVVQGALDPCMLNPTRVVNTEECTLNEDLTGWEARGVTETLPDSPLMGIGGG